MAKKLDPIKMKEKINKGYYITKYDDDSFELSHDTSNGYDSGVKITKERALEWIAAGAELVEL